MRTSVQMHIIPTGGEAEGRLTPSFFPLSWNGNDKPREQILRDGAKPRHVTSPVCLSISIDMVNRKTPLAQRNLLDSDRGRRYRLVCADALGPSADERRERQRWQHQQHQAQYSQRLRRTQHTQTLTNGDDMVIDPPPLDPLPPSHYLPPHQNDAIADFFQSLLFTQTDVPECATCFESYHGMLKGSRREWVRKGW